MKNLFLISLISLIVISCERNKEIDLDFPYIQKLVIYGFLGNEEGSYLQVYNNAPVAEENPDFSNSTAVAYLVENGIRVDTFMRDAEGKHRSTYPISERNDYVVEVNDNGQWYTSDEVMLEEVNFIEDVKSSADTSTNKIFIEIKLNQPPDSEFALEISSKYKGQDVDITYNTDEASNEYSMLIILSTRNPVFGPNNEILDVINLTSVDIKFTFYSYEVAKYSDSRSGLGGQIGNGNAPYRTPWTNVPGTLGYVTSYYQDSIKVVF